VHSALEPSRAPLGVQLFAGAVIVAVLAVVSAQSFLLFHSLAELFAIVIGSAVFLIAWNSRAIATNNFLLFVGTGYLAVSFIDLLHLLAFPGLNVLGEGRGLSSQLWLAARFLEAATLLAAPLFLRRRANPPLLFGGFGLAAGALLYLIFTGIFPATVAGGRLTPFKSVSEIAVAALFALAIVHLWRRRADVEPSVVSLTIASLALRVASELSLVVYADPYGPANFAGHTLKIAASYLLYKALIETLLMRPYSTLFRELKEREEELRSAVADLESFSYSVSHDLRSPLAAVRGYGELLVTDFRATPDDPRAEYAALVVQGTRRMEEIINDLLRLGRVSRGEIELATVDVSSLALNVVESLRKNDRGRRIEVAVEPDLRVHADPTLLRTALENLIGNAWKFTAQAPEPRIEIGLTESASGDPALYVRDNGAGFDGSQAEAIFAPFTRLHSTAEFDGTGIGLAIVQRVVQRHGGKVWAEAEVGKGATFYLQLSRPDPTRPGMRKGRGTPKDGPPVRLR
jgi:signal transduction histidine kinase